jgi:hypothetical protein
MITLPSSYLRKRSHIQRVLFFSIFIALTGNIHFMCAQQTTSLVLAFEETSPWNMTLRVTESSGVGSTMTLGVESDASDGLDHYDLPAPPPPPQFPYIRSWFVTSFAVPYDSLLHEYKSVATEKAIWNISLLWMPAPGNQSNTTLNLLWDSTRIPVNHTRSFLLYENDVVIADMIAENSFTFSTNGSLHRFQIIYQKVLSNSTEKPIEMPVLPLIVVGIVSVVSIVTIVVIIKKRKK